MLLQGSGEQTPVTSVAVRDLKTWPKPDAFPVQTLGLAQKMLPTIWQCAQVNPMLLLFLFCFCFFINAPPTSSNVTREHISGVQIHLPKITSKRLIREHLWVTQGTEESYLFLLFYFSNIDAGKVNFLWGVVVSFCFLIWAWSSITVWLCSKWKYYFEHNRLENNIQIKSSCNLFSKMSQHAPFWIEPQCLNLDIIFSRHGREACLVQTILL